jgi:5-methylcytosine-specific restriction endonuclease McrA
VNGGVTTIERGYDYEHRIASDAYRREHPLCEACVRHGVLTANASVDLHHIVKIIDAPSQRMVRANWLAVCKDCHAKLENDAEAGQAAKAWSVAH